MERRKALNRYYDSGRTDEQELGRAIAFLDLNHYLFEEGVDVYGGESGDAVPGFLTRMEHKSP
ncbi:hypothetical protein AArcMg_1506 [Natrarchaeobaculum sulfurireducens]|uniref:Uncharacterized protein n=1 Tax=Natrarchaeobaculum sulfurireducens TaxID=2044521 RepID=A0A346PPS4_9EURY|nr:hypothetical protein AArcMg_1506 [Natrarchaeobaculum sulfurireducens]